MPCRSLKIAYFSQQHINQSVIEVSALIIKIPFRCNKQLLQMHGSWLHTCSASTWVGKCCRCASGVQVHVVGKWFSVTWHMYTQTYTVHICHMYPHVYAVNFHHVPTDTRILIMMVQKKASRASWTLSARQPCIFVLGAVLSTYNGNEKYS